MSKPTASVRDCTSVDLEIGLMVSIADHLVPLFQTGSVDIPLARQMAVSAIGAYQPETPADFVNVARTIAFSMTALALLGKAAADDITVPDQIRAFNRANAFNRSADQSERTMMQRRRYQQARAHTGQLMPADGYAEFNARTDDSELQAAIADAMKEYLAARVVPDAGPAALEPAPEQASTPFPASASSLASSAPCPASAPSPASALSPASTALSDAILHPLQAISGVRPPVAPSAMAIDLGSPWSDSDQPRTIPFKEGLLRHSAMHRAGEQNGAHCPG